MKKLAVGLIVLVIAAPLYARHEAKGPLPTIYIEAQPESFRVQAEVYLSKGLKDEAHIVEQRDKADLLLECWATRTGTVASIVPIGRTWLGFGGPTVTYTLRLTNMTSSALVWEGFGNGGYLSKSLRKFMKKRNKRD